MTPGIIPDCVFDFYESKKLWFTKKIAPAWLYRVRPWPPTGIVHITADSHFPSWLSLIGDRMREETSPCIKMVCVATTLVRIHDGRQLPSPKQCALVFLWRHVVFIETTSTEHAHHIRADPERSGKRRRERIGGCEAEYVKYSGEPFTVTPSSDENWHWVEQRFHGHQFKAWSSL